MGPAPSWSVSTGEVPGISCSSGTGRLAAGGDTAGDGRHRPRRRDLRQAVHPSLGQADLRKEASHDLWGASLALFVVALVREKE